MIRNYEYYIFSYLKEILDFEKELINIYSLKGLPFNELDKFPRSGLLVINQKNFNYAYHGNGCTFRHDDIEITYGIYADRDNYITTSPFEFMQYINSYRKTNNEKLVTQIESLNYLDELSLLGVVKKVMENFLVYEIDLIWYSKFSKDSSFSTF